MVNRTKHGSSPTAKAVGVRAEERLMKSSFSRWVNDGTGLSTTPSKRRIYLSIISTSSSTLFICFINYHVPLFSPTDASLSSQSQPEHLHPFSGAGRNLFCYFSRFSIAVLIKISHFSESSTLKI